MKQREAKKYLYKQEKFSRAVFKQSDKATVTQGAKYQIHIHLWMLFSHSDVDLTLKIILMIYSDVRETQTDLITSMPSTPFVL